MMAVNRSPLARPKDAASRRKARRDAIYASRIPDDRQSFRPVEQQAGEWARSRPHLWLRGRRVSVPKCAGAMIPTIVAYAPAWQADEHLKLVRTRLRVGSVPVEYIEVSDMTLIVAAGCDVSEVCCTCVINTCNRLMYTFFPCPAGVLGSARGRGPMAWCAACASAHLPTRARRGKSWANANGRCYWRCTKAAAAATSKAATGPLS